MAQYTDELQWKNYLDQKKNALKKTISEVAAKQTWIVEVQIIGSSREMDQCHRHNSDI